MADIKTGIFAKNVQKRLSRAQEKVLQKLGKADETKDEQFEQFVQNFKRQEVEGTRLQREMRAYLTAVKGMQEASMKLTESLHEVYEPEWYGKDDVMTIGKNCDALWEDFHQKLVDGALITLDTYLGQFPDIKTRIAKRSRKLIDYDSARHHLETMQNSKRKDDGKMTKAEEEFNKAQKVFEELNIDLQEELPSLWDSRVGFYVNTFKNVTNLESKFHREIAVLCHKLYEVMTKLGEQHADKAFTIQGAPSDTGPLRLAKTPSPPDQESPPESPEASPNHMLAPASPAPARPKSPSQLRKGPPVPPPPKLTPTKELHQEQIISLFDDNFVPEINVTTPSQNETPGAVTEGSLLDLDFDPFKPDTTMPAGKTQSAISETLPWDLWTASAGPPQPVSNNAFNGFSQLDAGVSAFTSDSNQSVFDAMKPEVEASAAALDTTTPEPVSEPSQEVTAAEHSEPAEKPVEITEAEVKEPTVSVEAEPAEISAVDETESPSANPLETSTTDDTEKESPTTQALNVKPELEETNKEVTEDTKAKQEKMTIPSVVIEPASNNEGEEEEDLHGETVIEEEVSAASESKVSDSTESPPTIKETAAPSQAPEDSQQSTETAAPPAAAAPEPAIETKTEPASASGLPPNFLFKVETLHDFESANSDELDLKKGDVVLVIPSEAAEDQEAGWLTGIKESDWQQNADITHKGLFPENFTQRID
ncbi:amphiphysin isoform X6 [Amia ocellicauda]|uniref:amphiphysin isoform X6 n=1 Tax=Amia ocellicauda TaxID=2972642 RepID=UPI0034641D82